MTSYITFGADNDETAYQLFMVSKELLKKGGFNLRKFMTNSRDLQEKIDRVEDSKEKSVLGVQWNIEKDELIVGIPEVVNEDSDMIVTKRYVVHTVGKFFDPIGVLSPVVVRFKMFFQELCEAKIEWDQPLVGSLLDQWNALVSSLKGCSSICVPRYYYSGISGEIISQRLYGFCDASKRAYAAVIYLLICTKTSQVVRFVTSKTRVAPRQGQTIPRLELLSALLLARLIQKTAQCDLTLDPSICYTDSQVALHWICGKNKIWKQFVQNRVEEIRRLTEIDNWRHCVIIPQTYHLVEPDATNSE